MTRDLMKTATFAALHFTVGFAVTYAFTGSVAIAAGVALVEPAINTVVFFFHERAWRNADRKAGFGTDTVTLGGHAHGF